MAVRDKFNDCFPDDMPSGDRDHLWRMLSDVILPSYMKMKGRDLVRNLRHRVKTNGSEQLALRKQLVAQPTRQEDSKK
jgi:hypothetical protein